MTVTVAYARNDGTYPFVLTEAQRAQLQAVIEAQRSQYASDSDQIGLGVPIYELILGFISDEVTTTITRLSRPRAENSAMKAA